MPSLSDIDTAYALDQQRLAAEAAERQAELDRQAAEEAARQAAAEEAARQQKLAQTHNTPALINQPSQGGTTVGECTGFVIPDYIIQRESGGNPSAMNPSGAYGCAQTLLGHYNDGGACAGLNPYDIQGQRDCVYRLSNGGTNLAPWALTR
jgi:hypothetical protein